MKIGIEKINDMVCLDKINPAEEMKILDLDDEYSDCQPCDFYVETLEFSVEKYNDRKQKEIDIIRIADLINWFDYYFDRQLTQSQWQDDFTVSHDDYFDKDYANIDELKKQAKFVRDEIRKLRQKEKSN